MISIIAFAFAAFFNAVMDTLTDHFSVSVFKNLNPNFWDRSITWKHKKFLGIVVLDAWHIAKYGWLLSIITFGLCNKLEINLLGNLLIYPIIWFIVFETFYSRVLR